MMKTAGWAEIFSNVKTPLGILTLICLILGSVLHIQTDPLIVKLSFLTILLVTGFSIIYIAKNKSFLPSEIKSIWSKNDLPVPENESKAWIGKYNCRWSYRTKDDELKPYVDDIIDIESVDSVSGELSGIGYSCYTAGNRYYLRGRVSNKRIAHIFYTSDKEQAGLSGMVILSRPPLGDIHGWWLGTGRDGGDIGGSVIMEKHNLNPDFEIKAYRAD